MIHKIVVGVSDGDGDSIWHGLLNVFLYQSKTDNDVQHDVGHTGAFATLDFFLRIKVLRRAKMAILGGRAGR